MSSFLCMYVASQFCSKRVVLHSVSIKGFISLDINGFRHFRWGLGRGFRFRQVSSRRRVYKTQHEKMFFGIAVLLFFNVLFFLKMRLEMQTVVCMKGACCWNDALNMRQ